VFLDYGETLSVPSAKHYILTIAFLSFQQLFGTIVQAFESRYAISGNTLNFNMAVEDPEHKFTGSLEWYDVKNIADFLFEYPEIRTLRISGPGGHMQAAREISDKVLEFQLNTVASGLCASACARIFLAGKNRTLEANASLGFHRSWIDAESEKTYYQRTRATKGWKDEFEYLAWTYDTLVKNIAIDIRYMQSRGVTMEFILKRLETESYEMWKPTRQELLTHGVISQK